MKPTSLISALLATALLVSCGEEKNADTGKAGNTEQTVELRSTSQDVKEAIATGYGNDHAAAIADACTQAVSQVCGANVLKAVISARGNSAELGATMYEGILLSYSVLEDVKNSDGTFTIKIKAQVKPPASDMFKERIGIAIPSDTHLSMAFAKGSLSQTTATDVASSVEKSIIDIISQDSRFVVLDRESGIAESERRLANSSRTARTETNKSGSMKAADYVFDVIMEKGVESIQAQEFKVAKRTKYTFNLDVELPIRLVDVATGGVAAMERVSIQRAGVVWRQEECASAMKNGLKEECDKALSAKLTEMLKKLST